MKLKIFNPPFFRIGGLNLTPHLFKFILAISKFKFQNAKLPADAYALAGKHLKFKT
jgi:hypothetical protein